ncbi:MAG: hypothetical protein ACI9V1_003599 [Spirosomataceae bacterium]|jgi:hypothetical protein
MKSKRLYFIIFAVVVLLSIPLIAMQFSDSVNWTIADFAVMGALLLGTGLAVELTIRKVSNPKYRLAISLIILVILMLVWVELSIGIFGTPFAGN